MWRCDIRVSFDSRDHPNQLLRIQTPIRSSFGRISGKLCLRSCIDGDRSARRNNTNSWKFCSHTSHLPVNQKKRSFQQDSFSVRGSIAMVTYCWKKRFLLDTVLCLRFMKRILYYFSFKVQYFIRRVLMHFSYRLLLSLRFNMNHSCFFFCFCKFLSFSFQVFEILSHKFTKFFCGW